MAWTPWGNVDLIPGINVGNAVTQALTGKDTDVVANYSAAGGDRNPSKGQVWGQTDPGFLAAQKITGGNAPEVGGLWSGFNKSGNGVGGAGSGSAVDRNQLAMYDQAAGQYQNQLDRLQGQLNTAYGNIDKQYNIKNNELNSALDQARGQYGDQTTQNQQQRRTNLNTIEDQSSAGVRGLQRRLGAWGAGGSSEAMYSAPEAVMTQANQQRNGAAQTYSQNQSNLDSNWGNYQTQHENEKRKTDDWRNSQRQSAEAQSLSTRQDLLGKLGEIKSQRAAYAGGNGASAAQSYIDQANALNGRIDALAAINPTYTGVTPQYQQQALDSYNVGGSAASSTPGQSASGGDPTLTLWEQQKEKNKQNPYYG